MSMATLESSLLFLAYFWICGAQQRWQALSVGAYKQLQGTMHPSVASMPRTLLLGGNVVHSSDTLRDLILGFFKIILLGRIPRLAIRRRDASFHASTMAFPTKMVTFVRNLFLISIALSN
jgi:hypothetical protein